MEEIVINISRDKTKNVFDLFRTCDSFSRIVTAYDEVNTKRWPLFLGISKRLHRRFPDQSGLSGIPDERMEVIDKIKNEFQNMIIEYCSTL